MYRILSDLRVTKMAEHLEHVFEAYEESLRDSIAEVPVRARLAPLFEESPGHARLRSELGRLAREAEATKQTVTSEEALQTLYDCEMIAHDFYLNQLDHLSDPRLVRLFKTLAEEELAHAHVVSDAIRVLKEMRTRGGRHDSRVGASIQAD